MTNRTYNPCDECHYSYSRTGEESSTCKICELMYFKDLSPKQGKWEKYGYKWKCSVCGSKVNLDGTPLDNNLYYCSNCGAKMTQEN